MLPRVVVLISGRGSNLAALLAAQLPIHFAAVISNKADAGGLELARQEGIPTEVIDHRSYEDRAQFDQALMRKIDHYLQALPDSTDPRDQGLVILAGFMRIFSPTFTEHYSGRMVNIHPSLLPALTGLHTHQRALDAGIKIHGCSVHVVTAELDHGPILAQAAVPVLPDDDESSLAARVLKQEHQLYPRVVRAWAEGHLKISSHGPFTWIHSQHSEHFLQNPATEH